MPKVIAGQVFRSQDVRDEVSHTTTSLATGTETTIDAAETGYYHDLVLITGYNSSDAAVSITLRDTTGGDAVMTMTIPATDSRSLQFNPPLKQTTPASNWTADMGDYTNTTLTLLAQIVRELD